MNFLRTKIFPKFKHINKLVYAAGFITLFNYSKDIPCKLFNSFYFDDHLNKLPEKYGKDWAVITGGTNGIGLSFAKELSRLGYNVAIIARDQERLDSVCSSIESTYNVKTKAICFDFGNCKDDKAVEDLKSSVNSILNNERVSILVNNVGVMMSADYDNFFKFTHRDLIHCISTNILSQVIMYNLFLSKLKSQTGKSLIIDVSSIVADTYVVPDLVVYQATKQFNFNFSHLIKNYLNVDAIASDTTNNVDIALYKPGKTVSNLTPSHKKQNFLSETAEHAVLSCLSDIAAGKMETNGTFKHKVLTSFGRLIPDYMKIHFIFPYTRSSHSK